MASKKKKRALDYIETEGGAFILLPLENKKAWNGVGDEDEGIPSDYEKTEAFGTGVGVLPVGGGQALVLGNPEVTAYWRLDDGGVFIQRIMGDDDAAVAAVVEKALVETGWKKLDVELDAGKGKLALFDSACAYADTEADGRIAVALAPGKHTIETCTAKGSDIELELVRLRAIG